MSLEKQLRKNEQLCGTKILLGNGEKWTVPSMPLAKKKREPILKAMEDYDKLQLEAATAENQFQALGKALDSASELILIVLKLNYPELTLEHLEEHDLFALEHVPQIISILQGNEAMKDILGTVPGEQQRA